MARLDESYLIDVLSGSLAATVGLYVEAGLARLVNFLLHYSWILLLLFASLLREFRLLRSTVIHRVFRCFDEL